MMKRLRRYFVAGLLVWLPLGITVFLFRILIGLMDKSLVLIPRQYHPEELLGVSMNELAEAAIEHELAVLGADLEDRLTRTAKLLRAYRGEGVESDIEAFAREPVASERARVAEFLSRASERVAEARARRAALEVSIAASVARPSPNRVSACIRRFEPELAHLVESRKQASTRRFSEPWQNHAQTLRLPCRN